MSQKAIEHSGDKRIIVLLAGLSVFGISMIASASSISAYQNKLPTDYYMRSQVVSFCIGLVVFFLFARFVPYRWLYKKAVALWVASAVSLMLVFAPLFRAHWGTSSSWIYIPHVGSLQPVEFAKVWLIIYMASWAAGRVNEVRDFWAGAVSFAIAPLSIIGLLALQPDFGSILILSVVSFWMFYIVGGRKLHLFLGLSIAVAAGSLVLKSKKYISDRFLAFMDSSIDPLGIGYHIKQSLIAIGSWGMFGLGYGNSKQKFEYLPEAQSDSIFAIIAEEMGLFRTTLLVCAFFYLAYVCFDIARRSTDPFAKVLVMGIGALITVQAFLNIMVNMSLAPITGVTLPLISHGGSSLLSVMALLGLVYQISRYTTEPAWRSARPAHREDRSL